MSTSAIIMMIIAITLIWGGLAASIVLLRRHIQRAAQDTDSTGAP
ncbi:methionine/alanine import family NSS transporter small subunit [Haloechinothrix sp. YIM 98757]|uniref:Methionine/alanine import family NSS transporter small subunit n=1 Tax=Haloechinothrix aidingensis TaxID=2752311 RepID=A0A838AA55_9PSEU|nr:methionine/alanine import family NSS transporter small subunit [Haloechinothrix aidingensis]MBA0125901.1 methionine/alanine import family NSS transporter small subunit [Haloechinothrix aidingensis]